MMQTVLMNFGDNIRILQGPAGENIAIPVGTVTAADVHPVHLRMIQRAVASETLIVVDDTTAKYATRRFQMILDVLRSIDDEDGDALLERFNQINGPNPEDLRPSREMIRIACRELARAEVRKMMEQRAKDETEAALAANRVTIHEQGDANTRTEVIPPGAKQPPPPPKEDREQKPQKAASKLTKKPAIKAKRKIVRERL